MNPNGIPTSVTRMVYDAPLLPITFSGRMSQNDAAKFLAHFWPEIEAHHREQIAREIEEDLTAAPWPLDPSHLGTGPWIDRRDAVKAAAIVRREHKGDPS